MPELPEAEITTRKLRTLILGDPYFKTLWPDALEIKLSKFKDLIRS